MNLKAPVLALLALAAFGCATPIDPLCTVRYSGTRERHPNDWIVCTLSGAFANGCSVDAWRMPDATCDQWSIDGDGCALHCRNEDAIHDFFNASLGDKTPAYEHPSVKED